jgi:uncharacterized protein YndB with AHSA1/START domain
MPDKKTKLKFKQFVQAPPDEVFMAFSNATALCEWFCNVAQADAHEGGRLYVWWNSGYFASGEFTRLKPFKKIAFTWHGRGEPAVTQVKVTLSPDKGGTTVVLEHSGMNEEKIWKPAIAAFQRGWQVGLENLKSVLETGLDLRFVRLPLIGLAGVEPVSPDQAKEWGLPEGKSGLRILNLSPGLGAEAAGLQKDDILTKIAGQKLAGMADLIRVIRSHKAGEKISIQYYRAGEKQRTKMILSSRSLPEIPPTAEALAKVTHQINAAGLSDLRQRLEAGSEQEAAYKANPGDWSAHEALAHLIATERDTHAWIAGLIEGQEADFIYHIHQPARVQATLAAIPDTKGLLQELECLLAETEAMVASLPPEFVQRKRSYWRLGYNLLQTPAHFQEHGEQISASLASAQAASENREGKSETLKDKASQSMERTAPAAKRRRSKTRLNPESAGILSEE